MQICFSNIYLPNNMAKYWFGSLEEIMDQEIRDGKREPTATIARKGFKESADKYPTRRDFGEMCWEACIREGFDRDSGDYQLKVTGPIEIEDSAIDKAKRTLEKKGKTL